MWLFSYVACVDKILVETLLEVEKPVPFHNFNTYRYMCWKILFLHVPTRKLRIIITILRTA